MENAHDKSGEELIKTGVTNHLALQTLSSNAINSGIDPRKGFDFDANTVSGTTMDAIEPPSNPSVENGSNITDARLDLQSTEPLKHHDVAVTMSEAANAEDEHEADPASADDAGVGIVLGKKKKKRKPKSKRGINAATGFEEYYVDPPLTPAQHEEERGLYDVSRPFAERIETAIHRYVAKRNLNPDRKNLFDKYLTFGGIDTGPKMFSGGLDVETLESSNAQEIATLTATHSVPFDRSDPRNEAFVVDFEGCLKGFLSSRLPFTFEVIDEAKIKDYTGVIHNFLNYLLYHEVCPEYRDQVEASRKLCDQAQVELIKIAQAKILLPGTFNKACSEIFGGIFKGLGTESESWMTDADSAQSLGITPEHARQVFKFGFAAHGTDEQVKKYKLEAENQSFSVISEQDLGLEVTNISLGGSDPETRALYSHDGVKTLPILGKLHAKSWHKDSHTAQPEDLTVEEEEQLAKAGPAVKNYEFWVEDSLLESLFQGMKFEATVKQLSFGVWYFDAIFGIHCSFLTFLPNEMMIGWRQIEDEWLPPRSTEDEDGHDGQEAQGGDNDGELGEMNEP